MKVIPETHRVFQIKYLRLYEKAIIQMQTNCRNMEFCNKTKRISLSSFPESSKPHKSRLIHRNLIRYHTNVCPIGSFRRLEIQCQTSQTIYFHWETFSNFVKENNVGFPFWKRAIHNLMYAMLYAIKLFCSLSWKGYLHQLFSTPIILKY